MKAIFTAAVLSLGVLAFTGTAKADHDHGRHGHGRGGGWGHRHGGGGHHHHHGGWGHHHHHHHGGHWRPYRPRPYVYSYPAYGNGVYISTPGFGFNYVH